GDAASLANLGRWPLGRRVFGKAVQLLGQAGARVIAFDLLFAEPEEPVPAAVRSLARQAADALAETGNPQIRQALAHVADDNPDADLAAALKANGKTLLPLAFARFSGTPEEEPPQLADQVYERFDQSLA